MSEKYIIEFTDKKTERTFNIPSFLVNGPIDPTSIILHSNANSANTSLRLPGRGIPDFGEIIAENFIHLLEHFAGETPPTYPVSGQLWFDKTISDNYQLRVYNNAKYILTHVGTSTEFKIEPKNTVDQTELLTLLVENTKIRVFDNNDDGKQLEFELLNDSIFDGTYIVFNVKIAPTSTLNGWWVGGWEHVLQNNIPLYQDLDTNNNKIINLTDPVDDNDAVNKIYVDDKVSIIDTFLNEFGSINISSLSAGDILIHDGTDWVNIDTINNPFVSKSGSTMTGFLTLHDNPTNAFHAATKQYVDDEINALITGAVDLGQLADVELNGQLDNDILVFNGTTLDWENKPIDIFFQYHNDTNHGKILTVTPTGENPDLYDPILGIQPKVQYENNPTIATQNFVHDYVESYASSVGVDTFTIGGVYNSDGKTLTLDHNNPILPSFAPITFDFTTHNIDVNLDDVRLDSDKPLLFERVLYELPEYPNVDLHKILQQLNVIQGSYLQPKQRTVFNYNDSFTNPTLINLDESDYGVMSMYYIVESGGLNVYVNGIRQALSTHGWVLVALRYSNDALYAVWEGRSTNIDPSTTYTFDIDVNGNGPVTISVLGSDAYNFGILIDTINSIADANYWDSLTPNNAYAFGVTILNGYLKFSSGLPGNGSEIIVTDGAVNPLFAAIKNNSASFPVLESKTAPNAFYIEGNYELLFAVGNSIVIEDSTSNDGTYTIDVLMYDQITNRTEIIVLEPISTATINDGTLYFPLDLDLATESTYGPPNYAPLPITGMIDQIGRPGRESIEFQFTTGNEPTNGDLIEIIIDAEHVFDPR